MKTNMFERMFLENAVRFFVVIQLLDCRRIFWSKFRGNSSKHILRNHQVAWYVHICSIHFGRRDRISRKHGWKIRRKKPLGVTRYRRVNLLQEYAVDSIDNLAVETTMGSNENASKNRFIAISRTSVIAIQQRDCWNIKNLVISYRVLRIFSVMLNLINTILPEHENS